MQLQVSHIIRYIYLRARSQDTVQEDKYNENIRNEDNTSGLADDEMMTDVTKSHMDFCG